MVSEGAPKRPVVNRPCFDDIFEDESVRLEVGDTLEAYFGSGASAFVIVYPLFFPQARLGLAWKACDVQIDAGMLVDSGLGPSVLSNFERVEVMPDELSGVGLELRGADQDVRDAK